MYTVPLNHPDHMPSMIKGLKIHGTATDAIKKYREYHLEQKKIKQQQLGYNPYGGDVTVQPTAAPIFMTTKWNQMNYQASNFPYIKQLEAQASADLNPVYDNIKKYGSDAWRQVSDEDGTVYWMSWCPTGFVWTWTDPSKTTTVRASNGDDVKYSLTEFGSYSQSAQICGIHTYNLQAGELIGEGIIALLFAKCLSGFIADGLDFVVSAFATRLGAAALEIGLDLTFTLPEFVLPLVATCVVFAIVFVGLSYLFDWLNRKYTIKCQIFNWDTKYQWSCQKQYMSNAVIPGHDDGILNFNLPKMLAAGDHPPIPGAFDIKVLDSVCYYAQVIWNNDFTFMQGCSMAIEVSRDFGKYDPYHVDDGFSWAFNCPRWSDNQQALKDGIMDPEQYLNQVKKNNEWDHYPLKNSKVVTADKVLINFALDALEGGKDNLYNVLININAPSPNGQFYKL